MASNFLIGFHCPNPHFSSSSSSNLLQNKSPPLKFHSRCSSSSRKSAVSEGAEGRVKEEELLISSSSGSSSSARTQLDLLEQLSSGSQLVDGYESDGSYQKITIRDQLAQLFRDRDDDFSIPLGKNLKKVSAKFLTISQKRNIKRQAYLNEVSQRNDSVFFATVGAFVILPPIVILGIAILTGYVQLFP
ncbi:unnamed protein product [Citrullus colocynthis]|uniref:Uncharacterized protein n=1 Tax=Citrullus colocynthis TaxID=252529 RepID=A0ABP0Z0R2_9ROSI